MHKYGGVVSADKNFEFYTKTNLSEYEGKWVVIADEKVVSSGEDSKELLEEFQKKYPNKMPTIVRIPKKSFQVLSV